MADEKRFEETLKSWLESEGIYALGTPRQDMKVPPCGYWEKRWGGGKYVKSGLPDMHIVVRNVSIEIELKSEPGTAAPLQQKSNTDNRPHDIVIGGAVVLFYGIIS